MMDALSETLRVVRLVGAIFIHARFTAPWCYQSPRADSAATLLEPGAEQFAGFAYVAMIAFAVTLLVSFVVLFRMLRRHDDEGPPA